MRSPVEPRNLASQGLSWITRHRLVLLLIIIVVKGSLALIRLAVYFRFQPGRWYNFVSYWDFASTAAQGYYPYIHYWVEYPPVFPWVTTVLYGLSHVGGSSAQAIFYSLNALLLVAADCAGLFLVYRLGQRLYGEPRSATLCAAIQAFLFVPVYIYTGWFDTLPTALMLLAVLSIMNRRPRLAGAIVALGVLCKVFPVVAVPVAWLYLDRDQRRSFAGWGALVSMLLIAPLLIINPVMTIASARGYFQRPSWETIWAVIEGYFGSGAHPAPEMRFDPQYLSWVQHSGYIPGWLLFAALFVIATLVIIHVPRPLTPRNAVIIVGLLLNVLLLFSKGYSPQYLTWIIPWLALLAVERPVFLALTGGLAVANLLEYPGYFHFFRHEPTALVVAILLRTSLLALISILQWRMLFRSDKEDVT